MTLQHSRSVFPERDILIKGLDPNRAPLNLRPYLDSCDGALAVGGKIGLHGKQTHTIWALHRGGEEVGRVTVEGPPVLTPERVDLMMMRERADALIWQRAERLRLAAEERQRWVAIGAAALGYVAVLVGLFALGYLSAP